MAPRSKAQFKSIREEKRALIMDAALEHFARDGYHNTTITHLARHAGISKGLMYNYFTSKEELLAEIINKSMNEVSAYFDPDRDGILTEEEFELFVRKYLLLIKGKVAFWQLLLQLMLQKDVREQLLVAYSGKPQQGGFYKMSPHSKSDVFRIILDYYMRKKESKPPDYDPVLEMNMFMYTLSGFALTTIYAEKTDDTYFEKTLNRIIELYK
ncbi:MAG TPA: TetR/AcrR family transcriptional regulator [Bacteroidales bacterium]|nr:TetR/AcrR family transcriptional regulator [Bacteroidales bacterium]